jgi:hypothetical protein
MVEKRGKTTPISQNIVKNGENNRRIYKIKMSLDKIFINWERIRMKKHNIM